MLAEIATGRLHPDRLVSRVIELDEALHALAQLGEDGQPGATVVRIA